MKKVDLTAGPLLFNILRLSMPAVLMMLLQTLYNYVDTYFVGFLGAEALAGISTGSFILWLTFALAHLASAGIGAKVARRIGEGNRREADRTVLRGFFYSSGLAMLVAVILAWLIPALFTLMQTAPAVTRLGIGYLRPQLFGMPLIFLSFLINLVFTAAGDTRTPLIIMLLSLALNAVLDPVLIFGAAGWSGWGIAGAAWATVIARLLWLALALRELTRPGSVVSLRAHGRLGAGWRDALEVARIGAPKAATGVLFALVYMTLTRITTRFGVPYVAALRIGHIYEGLTFMAAMGFSVATGAAVGQNLGAGRPARAGRAAWSSSLIMAVYSSIIGLLFYLFAEELAGVFSPDPSVRHAAAVYLMILALSQPFMAVEAVLEGAFSGAGNTLPPMSVQLPLTVARYPLAYLLAFHTDLGVAGVWWAISGSTVVKCLLLMWWFSKKRWARIRV